MIETAAVLGAGSWGTALAKLLADKGLRTRLWARSAEQAEAIERARTNEAYLPGFELPDTLRATSDLREAVDGVDMVVSVVPTHGTREVLAAAAPSIPPGVPVVGATKGIENDTLETVSEIFEERFAADRCAYLGGPSFAKEVAAGIPTAVVLAGKDRRSTAAAQQAFATDVFRVYSTDDVVGVELGGALKNVVAIAAGIADGLGFGHNTRAALITRGLAEITRLAVARGADPLTMSGLGGMGDLVLTCTGDLSRNRQVGLALGRGQKLAEILAGMNMVAEGVRTTRSAHQLAQGQGVEMPITAEVHAALYEDKPPLDAVVALMRRPQRAERG